MALLLEVEFSDLLLRVPKLLSMWVGMALAIAKPNEPAVDRMSAVHLAHEAYATQRPAEVELAVEIPPYAVVAG